MRILAWVLVVLSIVNVIEAIAPAGTASAPNPLGGISVPMRMIPNPVRLRRDNAITPPYKSSGGAYAIGLTMGATSQTIYCNLDTGSFDLFVAGQLCTNCIQAPVSYTPSSDAYTVASCSSTFCSLGSSTNNYCDSGKCKSNATYGDGSGISAQIVSDRLGIPGLSSSAVVYFGDIITQFSGPSGVTYLSEGQSGLIGAAYVTGSSIPTGSGNILDALVSANNLNNIFSLCIKDPDPFMSLGADYYGVSGFTYTSNPREVYWQITVDDIDLKFSSSSESLGLSSTQYNNGGVIVDSGTSLLLLDTTIFQTFFETLSSACTNGVSLVGVCGQTQSSSIFENVFALTSSDIAAYPTLSIKVPCTTSVCDTLDLPPQFWILPTSRSGYYQAYITDSGRSGTILGDLFMKNFHVVFDKQRNEIGFAPQSTCNLSGAKVNGGARLCPSLMGLMPSVSEYFGQGASL